MRAKAMRFATTFAVLLATSAFTVVSPAAAADKSMVTVAITDGESLTYLDVRADHVAALVADGDVVAVAKPTVMTADSTWPTNDEYATDQWAIPAAGFDALPSRADGTGIVVAVIDSGVRANHEDLIGQVADGGDYVSVPSKTLTDPYGHGTHVAGIIAARSANGVGIAGGAPGVTIIAYRVLSVQPGEHLASGSSGDVAKAITAAVDAGANVINLSLGGPSNNKLVSAAVANAVERDTLIVASAGNDAADGNAPDWPAADPNVIAVGATVKGGERAEFSTTGAQLDLAAPGNNIVSTYNKSPSSYAEMSGTSMASPYVAAAAAAIWSAHPEATAAQVRTALKRAPSTGIRPPRQRRRHHHAQHRCRFSTRCHPLRRHIPLACVGRRRRLHSHPRRCPRAHRCQQRPRSQADRPGRHHPGRRCRRGVVERHRYEHRRLRLRDRLSLRVAPERLVAELPGRWHRRQRRDHQVSASGTVCFFSSTAPI
jgi:subtilisin family serine protease